MNRLSFVHFLIPLLILGAAVPGTECEAPPLPRGGRLGNARHPHGVARSVLGRSLENVQEVTGLPRWTKDGFVQRGLRRCRAGHPETWVPMLLRPQPARSGLEEALAPSAGLEDEELAQLRSLHEKFWRRLESKHPKLRDTGFYSSIGFESALSLVRELQKKGFLRPDTSFMDLGSGNGLVPLLVNAVAGADATGVERDADLIRSARQLTRLLARRRIVNPKRIHWHKKDIDRIGSLARFDLVYVYPPIKQGDWAYRPSSFVYSLRSGALLVVVGGAEDIGAGGRPLELPNVERIPFDLSWAKGYRRVKPSRFLPEKELPGPRAGLEEPLDQEAIYRGLESLLHHPAPTSLFLDVDGVLAKGELHSMSQPVKEQLDGFVEDAAGPSGKELILLTNTYARSIQRRIMDHLNSVSQAQTTLLASAGAQQEKHFIPEAALQAIDQWVRSQGGKDKVFQIDGWVEPQVRKYVWLPEESLQHGYIIGRTEFDRGEILSIDLTFHPDWVEQEQSKNRGVEDWVRDLKFLLSGQDVDGRILETLRPYHKSSIMWLPRKGSVLRRWVEESGLDPAQTWYVDDSARHFKEFPQVTKWSGVLIYTGPYDLDLAEMAPNVIQVAPPGSGSPSNGVEITEAILRVARAKHRAGGELFSSVKDLLSNFNLLPSTGLEEAVPTIRVRRAKTWSYTGVDQAGKEKPFGPPEAFFPVVIRPGGGETVFGVQHLGEYQRGWGGISWISLHQPDGKETHSLLSLKSTGKSAPEDTLILQGIPKKQTPGDLTTSDLLIVHGTQASPIATYFSLLAIPEAPSITAVERGGRSWNDLLEGEGSDGKQPYLLTYDQSEESLLLFSQEDHGVRMYLISRTAFLHGKQAKREREMYWPEENKPLSIASSDTGTLWVLTAMGQIESLESLRGGTYAKRLQFSGSQLAQWGLTQPNWQKGAFMASDSDDQIFLTTAAEPSLWIFTTWPHNEAGPRLRLDLRGLITPPEDPAARRPIPVWVEPTTNKILIGNPYPEQPGNQGRIFILPSILELERLLGGPPKHFSQGDDSDPDKPIRPTGDPLLQIQSLWGLRAIHSDLFLYDRSQNADSGRGWQRLGLSEGWQGSLQRDGRAAVSPSMALPSEQELPTPSGSSDFARTEISLGPNQGRLRLQAVVDGGFVYLHNEHTPSSEDKTTPYPSLLRLDPGVLKLVTASDRFWLEGISADSSQVTVGLLHSDSSLREEEYLELQILPHQMGGSESVQVLRRWKLDGQGLVGLVWLHELGAMVTHDALNNQMRLLKSLSAQQPPSAGLEGVVSEAVQGDQQRILQQLLINLAGLEEMKTAGLVQLRSDPEADLLDDEV